MTFSLHLRGLRPAPDQVIHICMIFAFTLTTFTCGLDGCFIDKGTKYGTTIPSGDIILHVGDPLELFCTIDLEKTKAINYTIDDLFFAKGRQPVDPRYVTRVNETTIRLYMENQTESEYMYYCHLQKNQSGDNAISNQLNSLEVATGPNLSRDHTMVCMNWVTVATEPRDVENFTCISLNWQILNCSWTLPKNYVKTEYRIYYTPKHRYSEKKFCPADTDFKQNFCMWSVRTDPIYRKNFDVLRFVINGTNKFKSSEQTFFFNHFAHVQMDPPKDLTLLAKNQTSLTLQWDIGDLQYFPKPIQYKLHYKYNNESQWDTMFCDAKNSGRTGKNVWCVLSGLMCNKIYNIRVFMKSSLATDKYWSNHNATSAKLFRTTASLPAHAPFTDIGSFQVEPNGGLSTRTVHVYWQPLKMAEQCGDNFQYNITVFEVTDGVDHRIDLKPMISGSFAKFEVGASKYRFEITAVNKEGVAPGVSSVVVPSTPEEVEPCSLFTKTDYEKTDNCTNMYEVSWLPPARSSSAIENYTIFWCEFDKERPYQCSGYLRWKTVAATLSKDTICVNSDDANSASIHQFAISANTRDSSSGMLWATCSVLHNQLGMVRHVHPAFNASTYIVVGWNLECMDQASTVLGYWVTYCPVATPNETACPSGPIYNVTWWLNNTHTTMGNLTDLQPYTYYRVTISMFNADRVGQSSVPKVLQTLEGAPNVDGRKAYLMQTGNTSVTIGWEPPRQMNGHLQHYLVEWRKPQQQEVKSEKVISKTQFSIPNMDPYTKYVVTVKACTSVCSREMAPIEVLTGIGKPGKVESIHIKQLDHGTLVEWSPPSQPAGPNPYYKGLMFKDDVQVFSDQTNGTSMLMPKPDCSADHNAKYEVRVYAINAEAKSAASNVDAGTQLPVIYEGEQIPNIFLNCADSGGMLWKILMWTTFPVLLMVMVGYGSRHCFFKCRQMKDVDVFVPLKFLVGTPPIDSKGDEMIASSYLQVNGLRQHDEFSTLFDKAAEQSV